MITLKQLRCLSALAETLHFHRAAERCHISQPALSAQ
ncbi:MAG: LysR family transcriptional regulator, partial [Rhodospirillales bacterium]|nr:LysR family transcriptional regulator [Rhodospirillales bacterium]